MDRMPLELHRQIISDLVAITQQPSADLFSLSLANHYLRAVASPTLSSQLDAIAAGSPRPPWEIYPGSEPTMRNETDEILASLHEWTLDPHGRKPKLQRFFHRKTLPAKPFTVPRQEGNKDWFRRGYEFAGSDEDVKAISLWMINNALDNMGFEVGELDAEPWFDGISDDEFLRRGLLHGPTFMICWQVRIRCDGIRMRYDEKTDSVMLFPKSERMA